MRILALILLLLPLSARADPFAGRSPTIELNVVSGKITPRRLAESREACTAIALRLGLTKNRWPIAMAQAASIEAFVKETGRARFEAAAIVGETFWLQPDSVLDRLHHVDAILRHECVHLALRRLGLPPLPVLLEEAIAVGLSGQAARLPPAKRLTKQELNHAAEQLQRPRQRVVFEQTIARATTTFWPALRGLSRRALLDYLRRVGAARGTWAQIPIPER